MTGYRTLTRCFSGLLKGYTHVYFRTVYPFIFIYITKPYTLCINVHRNSVSSLTSFFTLPIFFFLNFLSGSMYISLMSFVYSFLTRLSKTFFFFHFPSTLFLRSLYKCKISMTFLVYHIWVKYINRYSFCFISFVWKSLQFYIFPVLFVQI